MRSFLRDDNLTSAEQADILDLAARMKAEPHGHQPLVGLHSVVMISGMHVRVGGPSGTRRRTAAMPRRPSSVGCWNGEADG